MYIKFKNKLNLWKYGRQLDRHEKRNDGPDTEGHQDGKPQVLSDGQNWENKDFDPRVIFPHLAGC